MKINVLPKHKLPIPTILDNKIPTIVVNDSSENFLFPLNDDTTLIVTFDDIWEPTKSGGKELVLMNHEHTKKIIDFVEKFKDAETFFVACKGGICRSGAIGVCMNNFVNTTKYVEYDCFVMQNQHLHPNLFVLTMLFEDWRLHERSKNN